MKPGIHCLRISGASVPRKTWEFVFVCNCSVKLICIHPIHFCVIEKQQLRKQYLIHATCQAATNLLPKCHELRWAVLTSPTQE